jgi:hypothetical protein
VPSWPVHFAEKKFEVTGEPGEPLLHYYNDSSSAPYPLANPFAGSPALTRTDGTVDFNPS